MISNKVTDIINDSLSMKNQNIHSLLKKLIIELLSMNVIKKLKYISQLVKY